MSQISTEIGKQIRTFRKKRKMTLEALAAVICKSKSTVSKYENGEIPLAAGMSVNVTIDYEAGGDNLTVVPLSAIFQDKEKSSVWVYRPADKKVTQRQVKIRQILKEGRVVLDEGLQSGEIVVTAGVHKLKEGMEVERLKPVADTNIGGLL